eukprot:gene2948-3763_t
MPEMRSTRICVKGLPKHVDEKRVREHFSSKGVVTDVKILRTGDGRSRQFGFVGFRTEDEAEAAMSYFNRTFVDTSRISVELVFAMMKLGDFQINSVLLPTVKKSKHGRSDAEVEEDPMLKEFLEVMQPRHKKTLWGNDDATHLVMERKSVPAANGSKQLSQTHLKFQAKGKKKGGKKQQASGEDGEDTDMEESDSDEYEEADGADGEEDDESDSDGEDESDEEEVSEEDEAEKKVVKDAAVSDMDYLKSRATGSFDDDDDAFLNDGKGRLMHIMPAKAAPEAAPSDHPTIQRPGQSQFKQEREKQMKANANDKKSWNSLFMRADTVAAAVADRFGVTKSNLLDPEAGDAAVRLALGETHIIAETKQALSSEGVDVALLEAAASGAIGRFVLPPTKTLALVEFLEGSDARHAFKALAFKRFGKVPLYLEWAPEGVLSGAAPSTNPKNEASAAAVKGVASAAVEEEEEADPNATDTTCTLFIRNLKFTTGNDAFTTHLRKVAPKGFMRAMVKTKTGKKGEVLSCGFGFATYRTRESAQVAVKLAQSSKLDGHTLTLELSQQRKQEAQAGPAEEKGGKKKNKGLSATKIIVRNLAFEATQRDLHQLFSPFGQEAEEVGNTGRLYIRNLPYSTTEDELRDAFSPHGEISEVHIVKDRESGVSKVSPAQLLNLWSALGVSSPWLLCTPCTAPCREHAIAVHAARSSSGSSLLPAYQVGARDWLGVGQGFAYVLFMLPEDANTAMEILDRSIFQIKSIRIPRKFDGGHRGFAFVEFVTKKEAANAFDAIKSTHLYGRHLVLEYAKAEEGLEDLRERTSQQFQGQGLKRPAEAGEAEGSAAQGKKGKRIKGNLDDAGKAFTSFMDL